MKTLLRSGEKLLKQSAANLQRGAETAGGKLYLTDQRLVFEAHQFNIQSGVTEIALDRIREVQKCWTKFLNLVPLVPNSLAVFDTDGKEHRFVLFGRDEWSLEIQRQKNLVPNASASSKIDLPEVPTGAAEWYYEKSGERLGPVTEDHMLSAIQTKQLDKDSLVWRQGQSEWQALSSTKLSEHLDTTAPPPLLGSQINNTIVWILAFAPMIGEFLEGFIAGVVYQNAYVATLAQKQGKFWYVTVLLNIVLALMDERKLQAAGHDTQKFRMWAWLLVPVYLFQRAKFMQQSLAYFIVWCVCFAVAILFM